MPRVLEEPLLDIGVKHVNFFEGRILTGRDLRDQQGAENEQRKQLGRSIGDGVVEGYRVTVSNPGSDSASPVLHIEKGLAINRLGQTLELPHAEDVQLVRSEDTAKPDSGLFHACAIQAPGTELPNGSGFYILTVGPASGFQGDAPKSGLGDGGKGVGCGRRYATQGLRFRLLRFDPSTLSSVPASIRTQITTLIAATSGIASLVNPATRRQNVAMLRNLVANALLGSGPLAQFAMDPGAFGAAGSISPADPLDDLRGAAETNLTDCEVPLTVLYWNVNGVEYLDAWTVRRVVRQAWDPASLSMPLGFGLERLLQFQEQIAGLNNAAFLPASMRVEQFFRFLPPAGFYPAIGAGSPLGMSTTVFLSAFNTGQLDETSAGIAAEILERSFLFPPVDLQSTPFLQQYTLAENEAAAIAGDINQVHVLFVDRALNGPSSKDGVWETLSDAWDAYRGLIRRRVFLPLGTSAADAAARISIVESIRDVLDLATHYAARAGAWTLDKPRALEAFTRFHEVQKDFANVLLTGLTGVPDTQGRVPFANGLVQRLDTGVTGITGLAPAIDSANLVTVVRAQDEINRYIGASGGDGLAVGPFIVAFRQSLDGDTLVPGSATPFRFRFRLTNGTDRRLEFALTASIAAPSGTWEGRTEIRRTNGAPTTSLTLDSGAFADFDVHVRPPEDAQADETAVLTVNAATPPPTSRTETAERSLPIGTASTPPVTRSVKFETAFSGPNPATRPAGATVNYAFHFTYSAVDGPETASFDFFVDLQSSGGPPPPGWQVIIGTFPVTQTGSIFRATIPNVPRGTPHRRDIVIVAGPAGSSVTMRVRVQSTGLSPSFEDTHPAVINITST